MRNLARVRFTAVVLSLLSSSACLCARVGTVRTLTGETRTGQVRIIPERVVVVDAGRGQVYGIERTNLAQISFPTNAPVIPEDQSSGLLSPEWRETDIGPARLPGSTRQEDRTFVVRSSGRNIDGESDAFHYVYQPVRGDTEMVAEVVSIQYTHPAAKAGLMMRENLGEYSRNVMVALTAMQGGAFQLRAGERLDTGGRPFRALFAPHWVKLRRRGNEFTAFTSQNGRVWSLIEKASLAMNENFYVGLAVAGAREGMLNWTTFTKVRIAPKLVNEDFTPEVELTSGTIVAGRPRRADDEEVLFTGPPRSISVPTARVSRIIFQPLSGELAWKSRISRPGVWVAGGDFFDGELRALHGSKLTISSVLYGLRTFDIDDEVLALVLAPRRWLRPQFEVVLVDGSILQATGLALGEGEVKLRESALGEVRVPAFEIVELRRR